MSVFCKDGLACLTKLCLGITDTSAFWVRLFQNNWIPTIDDRLDSYNDCTLPGGGYKVIDPELWQSTIIGNSLIFFYPVLTWILGASADGQTIYGFFVEEHHSGKLVYASRFENPEVIGNLGGHLPIKLLLNLRNLQDFEIAD